MNSEAEQFQLPRAKLRRVASKLVSFAPKAQRPRDRSIKVICISDTHNSQPELPPGDILLHAGDLTEWGSFDEIQAQLNWLSLQPHQHKVMIAGNHDVLFDPKFLESERERFPVERGRAKEDLNWGSVVYLQDEAKVFDFPELGRSCTVYGSPWTPKYVKSAFQYSRDDDVWSAKIPKHVDILLTHGPPYGHLDGVRHSGCHYLAKTIEEQRPKLVVFGHIHVGHGREVVRFDSLTSTFEDVERGWAGWEAIPAMLLLLAWSRICSVVAKAFGLGKRERLTELINAAVVGEGNKLCNEASVAYI